MALVTMNPWRPVQLSASFLILSKAMSMIYFPMVYRPLAKLFAASYFPDKRDPGLKRVRYVPVLISSMTVGSRSIMRARGTNLPDEV